MEAATEPPVEPAEAPRSRCHPVSVVPAPPAPAENTLPPMPVEAAASPVAAASALTAAFEAGESHALSAAPEAVAAPAWPRTRLIAIVGAVVIAAVVIALIRGFSRPSAQPPLVSAHTEAAAQSPATAAPAAVELRCEYPPRRRARRAGGGAPGHSGRVADRPPHHPWTHQGLGARGRGYGRVGVRRGRRSRGTQPLLPAARGRGGEEVDLPADGGIGATHHAGAVRFQPGRYDGARASCIVTG